MCGRYSLAQDREALAERFSCPEPEFDFSPRYNLAPGQMAPVITADPGRWMRLQRWGLVPSFAREVPSAVKMINVRAESLRDKPAFRGLLQRRRCLVLADGFYEWAKSGRESRPFRFVLQSDSLFGLAGLWDRRIGPEGQTVETFAILTVPANDLVRPIHPRMPALLRPEDETAWLNPAPLDQAGLAEILRPYPAESMRAFPVSERLNSVAEDSPDLIRPHHHTLAGQSQKSLF